MELTLNEIFHLSEKEIANSKIELNMTEGKGGRPYIDIWLTAEADAKESGTVKCSYWGWHDEMKRNFHEGHTVFSFVRLTADEWLFVSAAEILDVPPNSRAKTRILGEYKPFFGRLVIRYKNKDRWGRYIFNMAGILDDCAVKEILPCPYSGEQFEGYDRVHLPFGRLADVFDGKIMPTYYEALQKITGIYCLTDTNTGMLYIGSATGEGGVAQRWGNYLESKHGGNKKLIALYREKGASYFEEYFTFTLLEYFGLSYDPVKILEREQYWKRCFSTIQNGYNDN